MFREMSRESSWMKGERTDRNDSKGGEDEDILRREILAGVREKKNRHEQSSLGGGQKTPF